MLGSWKTHKFGGTSVLNAERYRNVAKILEENVPASKKAIVVSAMKGVTDDLLGAVEAARQRAPDWRTRLQSIRARHERESTDLLAGDIRAAFHSVLARDFSDLERRLAAVEGAGRADQDIAEYVSGMGEVWSAQLLNAYFRQLGKKTDWLDAREVLVVHPSDKHVVVDWPKSRVRLADWRRRHDFDLVTVTGFVAATEAGVPTTLGRNGSDYSGSIFGALFECDEVFIWTDVDGVLSADPRLVPEATILDEMSYREVTELAYFGAKVVHPATMAPAIASKATIWVKNTFNPRHPGTRIHLEAKSDRIVKGFSTINDMCLLNIEGTGMVGVPGVAERLFGALRGAGVSVVLISQGSSEQSICLSIPESQSAVAKAAVERAFAAEIAAGLIQEVQVNGAVSILAAVGDNMAHTPGMAGKFFSSLGRSGVNVRAIAQGSSERNISAVIDAKDAMKALRTVHSDFILPHQRLSVGLIGAGLIGGTFLRQLQEQLRDLREKQDLDVQVRAIADSRRMLLAENGIDLTRWKEALAEKAEPLDLRKLAAHINPPHVPHAVIVEATASAALSPLYKEWLAQGLHIISPNKKANTGTMTEYRAIREAARKTNRHFLYSTNVGAGLPILQTLRDLCATGDEIQVVQGIFSGTLSFIFNQYDGTRPFSEIVRAAKEKGYTEPDPREDLSGQDVMRKLMILAREAGISIEAEDVAVESLVPPALQSVPVEEFLRRMDELDAPMAAKLTAARGAQQILRFVGSFDKEGKARVRLEALPAAHSFAHVSGTDNIVLFQTKRYLQQPLVVQGPGAGPEVTAAGVFADLLRLARYLGATP